MPNNRSREVNPVGDTPPSQPKRNDLPFRSDVPGKPASPITSTEVDVARHFSDFGPSQPSQAQRLVAELSERSKRTAAERSEDNQSRHSLIKKGQELHKEGYEKLKAASDALSTFRDLREEIGKIEIQPGESAEQFSAKLIALDDRATKLATSVKQMSDHTTSNLNAFVTEQKDKLDQANSLQGKAHKIEPFTRPEIAQIESDSNSSHWRIYTIESFGKANRGITTWDDLKQHIETLQSEIQEKIADAPVIHKMKRLETGLQSISQDTLNTKVKVKNIESYSKRVRHILDSEKVFKKEKGKHVRKQDLLSHSEIQFLRDHLERNRNFCHTLLTKLDKNSSSLTSYKATHAEISSSYRENDQYYNRIHRIGYQIPEAERHLEESRESIDREIQTCEQLIGTLDDLHKTCQEQSEQSQPHAWKEFFSNDENSKRVKEITAKLAGRYGGARQNGDDKILQQLATAKNVLMNKEYGISALEKLQDAMKANRMSLDEILSRYEKEQGFAERKVVDKLLKPHEFKRNLREKRPMFDPGAGIEHGPYTHLLQFSAILRQARQDGILEMEPTELYASMGQLRFTRSYNEFGTWDDIADANVPAIKTGKMKFSPIDISDEVSMWKMHQIFGFSDPDFVGEHLDSALTPGPLKQELQLAFLKQTHFGKNCTLNEKAYAQGIRDTIVQLEEQKLAGRLKPTDWHLGDGGKQARQHQQTINALRDELDLLDSAALEQRYATLKHVVPTQMDLDGDFFQARARIMAENAHA